MQKTSAESELHEVQHINLLCRHVSPHNVANIDVQTVKERHDDRDHDHYDVWR